MTDSDARSEAPPSTESGASGCSRHTDTGRCNAPLDRKNVRYCKAHRDEMAADYRARTRPRPTTEERVCAWCDNPFTWRSTHPRQDCCSKSCYMKKRHREEHPVEASELLPEDQFRCAGCSEVKLSVDYSPSVVTLLRQGRAGRCKVCMREYDRRWASDNKDKTSAATRRSRARRLLITYGAPTDDIDELIKRQGGRCACCSQVPTSWHIDHDHAKPESSSYRGLLCGGCNTGLGGFKDDLDTLRAAIAYLEAAATVTT